MKSSRALMFGVLCALIFSLPHYSHADTLPPTASPVILIQTLSVGSKGPDVTILQQFLLTQGYFTYGLPTGYFGAATKAAVTAFQRANGIPANGVAGPITRARIAILSMQVVALDTKATTTRKATRYSGGNSYPSNTFTVTPSGDGNESITPSSVQTVMTGATQSFTVVASSGYTRSNTVGGTCASGSWSGNTYTTGTVTQNCSVSFSSTLNTYALTVTKSGNATGVVTSSPAGIACGATCTASFASGTTVTLTAVPDGIYTFGGWSGGGCSGTGSCVVTMDAIKSVIASFINLFEA